MLKPYLKTITAVVTGLLGWSAIVVASESADITSTEWQLGAVALATALGVYTIANKPAE